MGPIIPSGSIPPPSQPWWSKGKKVDSEISYGTLAIVKPYHKGIFKHDWAGETVIVMELVQQAMSSVSFYRVMCHRGSMIISANDLYVIS